ncbi:zinc finger and BTB domain-containing protein 43-like isoform X20 [Physella acuta]|uniref:zinc finger and BTB domain-containing protein 43-like isoform X20 n=1 Tax=Physella acuta TaxID=109671 RepID=UPI0027DCD4F5|nr:zinc finger and BTB domain-containing protein 43-like isoform X20 [Physella acuta]XP_059147040.1 zinc finger and BTB domain-containing protein 43-like isoform X20 [Physella acuta]
MDFDSSSKFISSLAKFLQSLCNGYVEFNSGVEVIGHIYLNVDTGKKIDYILNEKVCKTDENSVTFISNSFHAQPAEKPKPSLKNSSDSTNKLNDSVEIKNTEDEIVIMDEPESKNVGTLPSRDSFRRKTGSPHSKFGRPTKRPHQSFSHGHKHLSKHHKPDPSSGPNGAQHDTESLHSESNSSSNFVTPQLTSETSLAAASDSEISHLSKVFPQSFGDTSNNQNAAEERDIKPQLDSEMNVIQVKQEFSHSEHGEEEQETYDDSQDHSTVFPGMPYDQYYLEGSRRGHRSEFGQAGLSQDFFPGAGPSGEGIGDSSASVSARVYIQGIGGFNQKPQSAGMKTSSGLYICQYCNRTFKYKVHYDGHINTHLNQKSFSCPSCGASFAYANNLSRHKRTCPYMRNRLLQQKNSMS